MKIYTKEIDGVLLLCNEHGETLEDQIEVVLTYSVGEINTANVCLHTHGHINKDGSISKGEYHA